MKDPTMALYSALRKMLTGQVISFEGTPFKILDNVPNLKKDAYIYIKSFTFSDDSAQDVDIVDGTFEIEIVRQSKFQSENFIAINTVGNKVAETLTRKDYGLIGFYIPLLPFMDNVTNFEERDSEENIISHKLMRFRLKIEER